ncbi:MAG: hypothetical protein Q8Q26_01925 [Pseudorhodobacter sp.]|nr:hypothetical protein [Pseudorhodobacter sp.]
MVFATRIALGFILLLGMVPAAVADQTADQQQALAALDGTWILHKDSADQVARTLAVWDSSVTILYKFPDGVAYAQGSWYARLTEAGRVAVIMRVTDQLITGLPDFEDVVAELEIVLTEPDSGEMWEGGVAARWGTIERSGCGLGMGFRDRTDTPPAGCEWLELKGVGYDGLTGECEWYADWEADWDKSRYDSDGKLHPMACLISVPAGFAQ